MNKTYSFTREKAAKILNISTRTIDRYIKAWKLSYKKVANKVLLAKEELDSLQNDFSMLHQEISTEIVNNASNSNTIATPTKSNQSNDAIDQKIDKFILVFKEKDKMLEEKNKVIFVLQQRVTELETKIQHMVALPDFNKEKQEAIVEKQKLEERISQLKWAIKNEKLKNLIFIWLSVIFVVVAGYFMLK